MAADTSVKVPYRYARHKVDLRFTSTSVEVFKDRASASPAIPEAR